MRARLVCTGLVGAGLILSGCLGSGGGTPAQNAGPAFSTPVRLIDCSDWRTASPAQRSAVIESVKAVAGAPTGSPAGNGAVLDDDRAYELFDNYCHASFATRFKLYKLYTHAAAFGAQ